MNSPGHNGKGIGAKACAAVIEYGLHELNIAKVYAANFAAASAVANAGSHGELRLRTAVGIIARWNR